MIAEFTRAFDALAARTWAASIVAAAFAGAICLAGAAASGMPKPTIHDEFSYLLAADTFAHGRVTNPTHPMWQHFETMHVLHQPSYQSMYPPGQGLVLALGQRLGHPAFGVWISACAMVAALVWMLGAWVPPRWALLGGLLAASQLLILGQPAPYLTIGYWARTFWGGSLAACGGALLWGAVPRIVRGARVRDAALLVIGLAMLAVSRPFEGLMASLPAALVLAFWLARQRGPALLASLVRAVLPITLGLVVLVAGLLWYNQRVTGDALKLPWVLHHEQYAVFPILMFQEERAEPEYRHARLKEFHTGWERELASRYRTLGDLRYYTSEKLGRIWRFYLGPLLTIPLLLLPWMLGDPWIRIALFGCASVGLANLTTTVVFPHYTAPAAGLLYVLVVSGLKRMSQLRPSGLPLGAVAVSCIFVGVFATMVVHVPDSARKPTSLSQSYERTRLIEELEMRGGKHLIIVRYAEPHSIHMEWVFNGADLEQAPILFARDMGEDRNRELLEHYSDRTVWLLVVSETIERPTPVPYVPANPSLAPDPANEPGLGAEEAG